MGGLDDSAAKVAGNHKEGTGPVSNVLASDADPVYFRSVSVWAAVAPHNPKVGDPAIQRCFSASSRRPRSAGD